jgi:hypothetical protein
MAVARQINDQFSGGDDNVSSAGGAFARAVRPIG